MTERHWWQQQKMVREDSRKAGSVVTERVFSLWQALSSYKTNELQNNSNSQGKMARKPGAGKNLEDNGEPCDFCLKCASSPSATALRSLSIWRVLSRFRVGASTSRVFLPFLQWVGWKVTATSALCEPKRKKIVRAWEMDWRDNGSGLLPQQSLQRELNCNIF